MQISSVLEEFLSEHVVRGSTPKTLHYYRSMLQFLLRPHLDKDISELNVFLVNKALQAIVDRNVAPATLASYDRALRSFTAWATGVELLTKDPMAGRKRPRVRTEPKQVLKPEEIQAMFNAVRSDRRYKERNTAILYLLLSTGIRAGELCNLCMNDINWQDGVLTVRGKTGHGTVPVDRRTLQLLKRYITHSRKATVQQVFVYANRPMTQNSLSQLVYRIGQKAGIDRPVRPHIMRHTFSTNFMEVNPDPFALKRILRHSTLHTSMQYVHNSTASIRRKMEEGSVMRGIQV